MPLHLNGNTLTPKWKHFYTTLETECKRKELQTKALSNTLLLLQRGIKILIGRHTLLVMKKPGYESVHRNGPHGYRVVELTGDEIYSLLHERRSLSDTLGIIIKKNSHHLRLKS